MGSIRSEISSLKKIIEKIDKENGCNDAINCIYDILYEISEKLEKIENSQKDINEYVTVLDENLGNIEDELYGFEEEKESLNDVDYIDVVCSKCHEVLAIEKNLFNNENKIICPNCHNTIKLK